MKIPPPEIFVDYLAFVALRMSIINDNLQNKDNYLTKEFIYITNDLFQQNKNDKNISSLSYTFIDNYYTYLNWNKDKTYFKEKLSIYKNLLRKLLSKKGKDLLWLIDKNIANSPRVHLNDFWQVEYIGSYQN
ncbi:MAG: hypothetical protein PWR24_1037 [Desulfonauticus sp.]|jgi:hypothetical protein|nr:hypothetical protein [Desulfonauticus sp.]